MENTELRIGNWINVPFGYPKIPLYRMVLSIESERITELGRIGFDDEGDVEYVTGDFIRPIPLTEAWLKKFGFEKFEMKGYKSRKWTLINSLYTSDYFYLINGEGHSKYKGQAVFNCRKYGKQLSQLKYVHQLQNLYFALTNKELKLKKS